MKVFIVGAGEVGFHIASSLAQEGHDLVVIERDRNKVRDLEKRLDALLVHADAVNPQVLRTRGIESAEIFFAVTNDDAANLLASITARKLGARRAVVRLGRVYHEFNPLLKDDPGLIPLYPERLVAEEILGLTRVPGAMKARFFAQERLVLLQAHPSRRAKIYGKPIKELQGPRGWILAGVRRHGELMIPRGDTVLQRGDDVYAVGLVESLEAFLTSIGVDSKPIKHAVIGGGGQVGRALGRLLSDEQIRVTIIQRSKSRARQLASQLPEVLVLQGNATDPEILREAEVPECQLFVAATQGDEDNIFAALLAKELGARSTVVLSHSSEFRDVLRTVRIGLALSPRMVIAGTILRMVHRREILSLDMVEEGDAEVAEFEVPEKARVLRKPIKQLGFPRSAIVGAVIRGEEIFVPDGDFTFAVGDRVLVFTLADSLPALEKLFRGS